MYEPLNFLIDYLIEQKIEFGDEFLWKLDRRHHQVGYVFDLSLAHGAAGILYFLGRCYEVNVKKVECQRLIDGIMTFLMNNLQDESTVGSYFGSRFTCDNYLLNKKEVATSRVGWCYGDLTILYTMLYIARIFNDRALNLATLERLKTTAKRVLKESTFVRDAGFCHGSSGNAFIYHDLYLKTDVVEFKHARDFWIEETLAYLKNPAEIDPKYVFIGGADSTEIECDNLLEGVLGVGVTYNFLLYKNLPDCKDCFMMY